MPLFQVLLFCLLLRTPAEAATASVSYEFTGFPNATHSYVMKWTTENLKLHEAKSWCTSQTPSLALFGEYPIDKASYEEMVKFHE